MAGTEQILPDGWQKVYDTNTGHHYYCNTEKGITQWTPPIVTPEPTPAPSQQAEQSNEASSEGGWYYRDAYGIMQGPFIQEKLRAWRHLLPMDLVVTFKAAPATAADGPAAAAAVAAGGSGAGGDGDKGEEAEDDDAEFSTELGELLGDGDTLADWRKQCGAQGGAAPPAPVWEHWLATRKAAAAAAGARTTAPVSATKSQHSQDSEAGSSGPAGSFSYAEAVIAGLSPDDEAVQIARLAAGAGKSIQDLLDFSYGAAGRRGAEDEGASVAGEAHDSAVDGSTAGWYSTGTQAGVDASVTHAGGVAGWEGYAAGAAAHAGTSYGEAGGPGGDEGEQDDGEYSFSANFDPRQRRLVLKQKDPQGPQALYGELSSWVDPAELERSLQEAARRKGMKLAPNVWKKLKERKMQMKKKAKWLA